jgi:hypothetical protein
VEAALALDHLPNQQTKGLPHFATGSGLSLSLSLSLAITITITITKGRREKKKGEVSEYFFWKLRRFSRDFFNGVFELPLSRNAQKRDKTKPNKTTVV